MTTVQLQKSRQETRLFEDMTMVLICRSLLVLKKIAEGIVHFKKIVDFQAIIQSKGHAEASYD